MIAGHGFERQTNLLVEKNLLSLHLLLIDTCLERQKKGVNKCQSELDASIRTTGITITPMKL